MLHSVIAWLTYCSSLCGLVFRKMSENTQLDSLSSVDSTDVEEAIHFTRVIKSFRLYRKHTLKEIENREKNFKSLSQKHQDLLPDHLQILREWIPRIEQNGAICQLIVKNCENAFQNKSFEEMQMGKDGGMSTAPRPMDMEKVGTTLKQIMRDWSNDGQAERDLCYKPIIEEIESRIPVSCNGRKKSVLVPGCGLGRLAWELAKRGYRCEGNEFSFFMLFTSDFILNRTPYTDDNRFHQYTIYPWVSQKCNVSSWGAVTASVKFPDANPATLPPNSEFSMAAGDFLDCYVTSQTWDCVATCYFIDTAHNIIAYIERIFDILTPGGLWVNMGPLLYHFANMPSELSVEFSYEQIIEIIKKVGFEIIKDERAIPSTYISNPASMLQYTYKCAFLVAVKPMV